MLPSNSSARFPIVRTTRILFPLLWAHECFPVPTPPEDAASTILKHDPSSILPVSLGEVEAQTDTGTWLRFFFL